MIRVDKEEIISELNLTSFGNQGFYQNKNEVCPFCGKGGKWGIVFDENRSGIFHCFKCSEKASLYDFLKKIGRLDLSRVKYEKTLNQTLSKIFKEEEENQITNEDLPEITLPIRLKPIEKDEYLDGRGWQKRHYDQFEPSYTNSPLEKKLQNYIVFKIKQKGAIVAFLARSRYSKEWHKKNLEDYKKGETNLVLRYVNSETNFTKILGAYDEVPYGTDTVIIVEGLFDYINIDRLLRLDKEPTIKCCFSFGNSFSVEQIKLLKEKDVKRVILMYDYDTIKESKSYSLKMMKEFKVQVACIQDEGIDPGNMTLKYLLKVLDNLTDPINFYKDKLLNHI